MNNGTKVSFSNMLQDLATLGSRNHEGLTIQQTKGGQSYPQTTRRSWLTRFIQRIFPSLCAKKEQKIAEIALVLFEKHQTEISQLQDLDTVRKIKHFAGKNQDLQQRFEHVIEQYFTRNAEKHAQPSCERFRKEAENKCTDLFAETEKNKQQKIQERDRQIVQIKEKQKHVLENMSKQCDDIRQDAQKKQQNILKEHSEKIKQLQNQMQINASEIRKLQEKKEQSESNTVLICKDGIFRVALQDLHSTPFFRDTASELILSRSATDPCMYRFLLSNFSRATVSHFLNFLKDPDSLATIQETSLLIDLYQFAYFAHAKKLKSSCEPLLKKQLTDEQLFALFLQGPYPSSHPLKQQAYDRIAYDFLSWSTKPEFFKISHEDLIQIIGSKHLSIENSTKLFEIILDWADHCVTTKGKSVKKILAEKIGKVSLLNQIRWTYYSPKKREEFLKEWQLSTLEEASEYQDLYYAD